MTMKNEKETYSISRVCAITGVTPKQLRDWDSKGILVARRTGESVANNRKIYTEDDIARIQEILLLKDLGLSLAEIKQFPALSDKERHNVLSECIARSEQQHALIKKRLLLSLAAEHLGFDKVQKDASLFGSSDLLALSYENDESLRQFLHWLHSHTEKDVAELAQRLLETSRGFAALQGAPWEDIELQIARFCDVMSTSLGWPSAGQMLSLSFGFALHNDVAQEIDRILGEGTTEFISKVFLLAWASSAAECLDDIFAALYFALLKNTSALKRKALPPYLTDCADSLVAFVCEFGCDPHLADAPHSSERTQSILAIADEVFALLEETLLDEEIEQYLDLDDFPALDGSALSAAQGLLAPFLKGELSQRLANGGLGSLRHQAEEWRDDVLLFLYEGKRLGADAGPNDEEGLFEAWFHERYPDAPEGAWATEAQSCERERATRELLEETASRTTGTAPSQSTSDELSGKGRLKRDQ